MFKKFFAPLLLSVLFVLPVHAQVTEDFSQMNPTVKVKSYKHLFIDEVLLYGSGSGTVISSDGLIVTNHHVIFDEDAFKSLDAFEICITFDTKSEPVCKYTATLIDHDPDMDIALLKINPLDVFGEPIPSLKFLSYDHGSAPQEATEIRVNGYPGSGGKTITSTKGQISGFEEFNGFNYFKTDTDFDHGSSGGTAMDSDGNYIGVPTYIRSYAENVGYFLDIREAKQWLDETSAQAAAVKASNSPAEKILARDAAEFYGANQNLSYTQSHYPYLKVDLPAGWEFLEINHSSLFAGQKNLSNPVGISMQTLPYQFEIEQDYLDKLQEELDYVKDSFADFKKEEVSFAGQKAWKISYTSILNKNVTYYIPYGYTLVVLNYSIDLDESDKQTKALQPVIDSIEFTKAPLADPKLSKKIEFTTPPFSIQSIGDWKLQRNHEKRSRDLLIEGVEKGNFEGNFAVYYDEIYKDEQVLSSEERLDEVVKNLRGQKLVYKNDQVMLGGLKGFLFTYEYEGDKFQQIRKNMIIKLQSGDYEFTLEYDDLTDDFDRNLPAIKQMLDTFQFNGEGGNPEAQNSYGNLGYTFLDLQHHRYAQPIGELADLGIIDGRGDGTFDPEGLITRAEAIKWIYESKNHLESDRNSKKVVDFSAYQRKSDSPADVLRHPDRHYVYYGQQVGHLKKSPAFRPNDTVNMAEAVKIILETYEVPIWRGQTNPWFKKYVDKAFELRLIPYGMYDPSQSLNRGELAYLINEIYQQSK